MTKPEDERGSELRVLKGLDAHTRRDPQARRTRRSSYLSIYLSIYLSLSLSLSLLLALIYLLFSDIQRAV